jgi:WD40 repeat protein
MFASNKIIQEYFVKRVQVQDDIVAFSSNSQVTVYPTKKISTKELLQTFCLRRNYQKEEGKKFNPLVASADEKGGIFIHDVHSRALLRQFEVKDSVGSMIFDEFLYVGTKDIHIYDLFELQSTLSGHQDYIQSMSLQVPLLASGSLDHTVKVWNIYTKEMMYELQFSAPVQGVLFFKELLFVISGNKLSVYSVTNLIHQFTILKDFTDIQTDGDHIYLASSDKTVRIMDLEFKIHSTIQYPKPVASMGVSKKYLVVGMQGLVSIRTRKQKKELTSFERQNERFDGIVIERKRSKALAPHMKLLNKFQYTKCLSTILTPNEQGSSINKHQLYTVLQELDYRNALQSTLSQLESEELEKLVRVVVKWLGGDKSLMCIQVLEIVFGTEDFPSLVNGNALFGGFGEEETANMVKTQVWQEVQTQFEILKVVGVVGSLIGK